MSYVTIYAVHENGDVARYGEVRNNHAFAPVVWEKLTVQYGLHPTGSPYDMTPPYNYKPLCGMFDTQQLTPADALLLGVTFDRVWCRRDVVPALIGSMRTFHERYIEPTKIEPTINKAADILQRWFEECPFDRGVAFHMCSADPSFWSVHVDGEEGVDRYYNIDKDKGNAYVQEGMHWELGEALHV